MDGPYIQERAGTSRWCVAPRLTSRLKARGYERAIHPKTYKKWAAEYAAEELEDRLQDAIKLLRDIRENGWTASQDRDIVERMRAILA